jgi:hypothetical protein
MRIRSIKPAYWTDPDLHTGLSAAAREFYIGLWMLADDAGWLEWEPRRIGAELYAFLTMPRRLREVEQHRAALCALDPADPHLVVHDCGHAQVPKMPQHQYLGGKPVYTVSRKHQGCLSKHGAPPDIPMNPQDTHNGKGSNGGVGNGEGRGGVGGIIEYDPVEQRLKRRAGT